MKNRIKGILERRSIKKSENANSIDEINLSNKENCFTQVFEKEKIVGTIKDIYQLAKEASNKEGIEAEEYLDEIIKIQEAKIKNYKRGIKCVYLSTGIIALNTLVFMFGNMWIFTKVLMVTTLLLNGCIYYFVQKKIKETKLALLMTRKTKDSIQS